MNLLQVRFAAQWQNNVQDAASEPAAAGHAVGEHNLISLTMSALSNCFCAHFCRRTAERVCLQCSFTRALTTTARL
jgi:hypothetical protein